MNRVDRLIAILTTLQGKKRTPIDFLTNKFNLSERTIYRDLKALGEIGVPIYFEDGKGYSIVSQYFLPPVALTTEEANALILIAQLSERFGDDSTQIHVKNALTKIKAVLKNDKKEKINEFESQISIYNPDSNANKTNYLGSIQESITDKITLKISYIDNNKTTTKRIIEPIGITFYSDQWHLIAWCQLREAYRDFKVLQIQNLSKCSEPFQKSNHLDLNSYIQSISEFIPPQKKEKD